MKRLLALLFLTAWLPVCAQVPRDTSFTVYSAYVKAVKKQPFISIVYPQMPAGVVADTGVVYATIGTRRLHADIFYPTGKKHQLMPAILLIHGGGWRSGNREQQVPMAQQLAAKGYVAVVSEYRLSPEAKYPAAVYDLKAAIRWMRANAKQYDIDKNKVAVLGCSAGGQLAALMGTTNGVQQFEGNEGNNQEKSAVDVVVDIDGILAFTHPESGEGDESKGVSAAAYWLGATREQDPQLWLDASALTHVSGTMPPFLFINSSVARMHAGRDDMIQRMDSLHIYHEVQTFTDAPHPFWLFDPWFVPTVDHTVSFLHKVFGYKY